MDYPKSVPGVGLVGGKFVDENAAVGQIGSLIPSKWGNDVTDEILNVLNAAGIAPNEASSDQLRQAIITIIEAKAVSIETLEAYAKLVSPAFTGSPTAPTQAAGNNSTRLATTAFVAAVQTSLTSFINAKAPLASPSFTGVATAPTPAKTVNTDQLATTAFVQSVAGDFPKVFSISALPATNVGPIIVSEVAEIWHWVSNTYFTGYRNPSCGRPVDGHTITPLASEIDAVGGTLLKAAYPALWAYAQENNLVVTQAVWAANPGAHWFVNVNTTTFRTPDLRNMFRRYTGTDADTANARVLASKQGDAIRNITGNVGAVQEQAASSGVFQRQGSATGNHQGGPYNFFLVDFDASRMSPTGGDIRGVNTAYHPRIHI